MALTAAERQKRRREKLKSEGKYEEFKKKHLEEARRSQAKQKEMSLQLSQRQQRLLLEERRAKTRERVRKHRQHKMQDQQPSTSCKTGLSPYKSCSALGKAMARANRFLPSSPRHKVVVVRKLFSDLCGNTSDGKSERSSDGTSPQNRGLSSETRDLVTSFYCRDDVSRQSPGRKDTRVIRENNEKKTVHIRHLVMSIMETYEAFKQEHPEVQIGKSKFAELRPPHVQLSNKLPHNVCLCKYHENFINAINSLHKKHDNIPAYSNTFVSSIICQPPSELCWRNECNTCQNGRGFNKAYKIEQLEVVNLSWYIWKMEENGSKIIKVKEEGSTTDIVKYIISLIPQFLIHCYTKRAQSAAYYQQKEMVLNQNSKEFALLHIDFAENYTCVYQDEVQSAHWAQAVSLWHSGSHHPIIVVSDNLNHSKDSVIAYISKVLSLVPENVKVVSIWSDGPASQFKNKYITAAVPQLQLFHKVEIYWNYFATSHGKGAVDGIGAVAKRQVWNAVKMRKFIVGNASTFAQVAASTTNMQVFHMPSDEVQEINLRLNLAQIFSAASSVPNIKNIHCFHYKKEVLQTHLLTPKNFPVADHTEETIESVKVGDWCKVEYDGKFYAGEVRAICGNSYLISAMQRAGNYWKWPAKCDEILYTRDKIIKKISPPVVVNTRGYFQLSDF